MIDMDGQVQLAADNDKSAEPANETPNAVTDDAAIEAAAYEEALISPAEPASSVEAFADPQTETSSSEEESAGFGENTGENQFANQEDPLSDQAENPLELNPTEGSIEEPASESLENSGDSYEATSEEAPVEGSPAEPSSSDDNANWFDQGLDQPPPEPEQAIAPVSSGDFSDVSDFGNQDVDAGALQFDLTLSGIDHKEMRAEVMDVLADPRLYLNLRDLPVKNGTIVLPGLNAARTSLIVTRLQHLNLRINWKQRLYEA